ncbi:MAG: tetratricopeptide repeat protein, partial [Polaromonas sp.]
MTLKLTVLVLSLGLSAVAANAQTMDLGPDSTGYQRFLLYPHLERGFDAMARGDRSIALSEFEQAHVLAPNNPVVALHLAQAYRRFGEPARAEAVLREQLKRNPGNRRLTQALADLRGTTPKSGRAASPAPLPATAASLPVTQPQRPSDAVAQAEPAAQPPSKVERTKRQAPPIRTSKPLTAAAKRANAAYAFADKAYKASARGEHADAVVSAREALRLVPQSIAYRSLLVYELSETGQLEEADAVASQVPPQAVGSTDELAARQKMIRRHIAFKYFDLANQAGSAGRQDEALAASSQGIEYAPDLLAHRLQLVGLLLTAGQWPQAAQSATDALDAVGNQPALRVLRAYALQRQGQRALAEADLDSALAAADLKASEQKNFRLIAADAALAAGEPKKALDLLESQRFVQGSEQSVANRRKLAFRAYMRNASANGASPQEWLMPKVICVGKNFSAWCEVWPGENPPDPGYAAADAAYKAYGARNHEVAIANARQAVQLSPANRQYRLLLVSALTASGQLDLADNQASQFLDTYGNDGEMLALRSRVRQRLGQPALAAADAESALQTGSLSVAGEAGMLLLLERKQEARERFNTALHDGTLADQPKLDTAYLAVQVGDDDAALTAFNHASSTKSLPDTALQDAAYAAGRLGRNEESVSYFKRAIDAADAGQLPLTPQEVFNARRSVADRTRKGGVYGSLTYRGISTSGLALNPGGTNDTLQTGLEAYWRPLGYGDGRLVELYGGLLGTLYSKEAGPVGASTVQGTLGARVKPLAQANLVLALERRLAIGSQSQTDWLARVGYSWDKGLDLRVDAPAWWSAQVYAEAGRFIKAKQNYATFEGQAGRSFRLDDIHPKL